MEYEYNGKIYRQMEMDKNYYVGLEKGKILKYRLHFLKVKNNKVLKEFFGRLEHDCGEMLLDNCCDFDLQDAMYKGFSNYLENKIGNNDSYFDKLELANQLSAQGYAGFR